jgi:DNA-binding HxlR family transcriptional regulator
VRWKRVTELLEAVNGTWAAPVLRHLDKGTWRPGELLDAINRSRPPTAQLSRTVLLNVLRRLVSLDLAIRQEVAGGWSPEVYYWLTPAGLDVLGRVSRIGPGNGAGAATTADIDVSVPSPARVWDYLLGGKNNFAADRHAARQAAARMPDLPALARHVRSFRDDAVLRLAAAGVRQFLDLGTGLPGPESVHQVAQSVAPDSRVVYVDNDPMVAAHARALLTSGPGGACDYVEEDIRNPGKILARAARTLDLSQPTAVLLIAVLHFIPDEDDPWRITARLLSGITGDAYLVVSHGASDLSPDPGGTQAAYNERVAVPLQLRPRHDVARFFNGLETLGPGLVPLGSWQPGGPAADGDQAGLAGHVGIGRRPAGDRQSAETRPSVSGQLRDPQRT